MRELKSDVLDRVSGGFVFPVSVLAGLCIMEIYKQCAGKLVLEPYLEDTYVETKVDLYSAEGFWIGYDVDRYVITQEKIRSIYVF